MKTQNVSVVERLSRAARGWWESVEWRLSCWLAKGLIHLGVNRNPRAMVRVYRVSPALMGLILFLSESSRASNQVHLYWDGSETPTNFDDLMNDIAKLIERAPTPMGADDYSSWRVRGDCYYDWKHGDGKRKVRALLKEADPTPEAPVTVIEVICTGRVVTRTLKGFKSQRRK